MDANFWNFVSVAGPDECWNWTGKLDRHGYGVYRKGGKTYIAHRCTYGRIPAGMDLLHSCNNRRCCNPRHLRPGTPKENSDDMMRSGRQRNGRKRIFTPDDIYTIRCLALYNFEKLVDIAKKMQTEPVTIGCIVREKTWKRIHPLCHAPATHYVLSEFGGYFIPLCNEHMGMLKKDPRPLSELGERDIPGCSFVR